MIYCINPRCLHRQNPDHLRHCQACGSSLLIHEQYRLIRPLRELNEQHPTEIFEVDHGGVLKVLKVLTTNRRRLIELFQREAEVLQRLRHSGIPRVDSHFIFSPSDGSRELHCLVMEKIPGQNLKQWLEENGAISETFAIDWLQQLVNILSVVHQEQLLHRDIKPSNIMMCPDGQLVLIDFGAVREVTGTYIEKLEESDVTRVYSRGYTAPEQFNGQAVWQSDFFALGRTFVHLLTGIYPDYLPQDSQTYQLIWRDKAPQVSRALADLIDQLMAPLPQNRSRNPKLILDHLVAIQSSDTAELPMLSHNFPTGQTLGKQLGGEEGFSVTQSATRYDRPISRTRGTLPKVVLWSVIITSIVMGVRYLGILQPVELWAFDQLMRQRPDEGPDQRLLVVTITEEDFELPEQQDRKGSISDLALARLLEKLTQFKPRAIGLDIYRDFPAESQNTGLAQRLRDSDHFFAICKVSVNAPGIKPPPEVPVRRLGFSDFILDPDGILRRHLVAMNPGSVSPCTTPYALSAQLVFRYLAAEGISAKYTPKGELQLGNVIFKRWRTPMGGYQQIDDWGYQILLNYRSYRSPLEIAERVSLKDVLTGRVTQEAVKDRIILIGVATRSSGDYFATPYSTRKGTYEEMPGVMAHAQMVSQMLSAVKDRRPQLWAWPIWGDSLWVWGWSIVGGLLAWRCHSLRYLGVIEGVTLGVIYGLCFGFLLQGGWMPLVPSALALCLTGTSVVAFSPSGSQRPDYTPTILDDD